MSARVHPHGSPPVNPVIDARSLPEVTFGSHNVNTWATVGFMIIEGSSLAACLASYLYLRKNVAAWPPHDTPLPDLLIPAINAALLLAMIVPMHLAGRAAGQLEGARVRRWLLLALAMSVVATVLRGFEFAALNVRWHHNAYASAAWWALGLHGTLVVVDLVEKAVLALMLHQRPNTQKLYPDVEDAALYQWFLALINLPVFVIVFLSPWFL
jgi:heme/copper-type cytochrome/quinol oxidase subunit 3